MQKSPQDGQYHPVHYMSKKTTDAERKYTSYELEVFAVVKATEKLRVFLLPIHFKTRTIEKKHSFRDARGFIHLQDYDYTVEHRSGTQIRHADALSRCPLMIINDDFISNICRAQAQDE